MSPPKDPDRYKLYLQRQSEAQKKSWSSAPSTRRDGASKSGRVNIMNADNRGRKWTREHRDKHRQRMKGNTFAKATKGRKDSPEVIERKKRAQQGIGRPFDSTTCDICGNMQSVKMYRDHNHKTGLQRGRLCRSCNFAIGLMKDDPRKLKAAIRYLESWDKESEEKKRKWDLRFLTLAKHVSQYSKDPSTQVGAVIVRPDRTVVSLGYNGFPRGTSDDPALYADRPTKLDRVVHGEVNAILTAKEPLVGYTLYLFPFLSCIRCATMVIQVGLARVVATVPTADQEARWDFNKSRNLFTEVGITVEELSL